MKHKIYCQYCQEEIKGKRQDAKYCSESCRNKENNLKKRIEEEFLPMAVAKDFETHSTCEMPHEEEGNFQYIRISQETVSKLKKRRESFSNQFGKAFGDISLDSIINSLLELSMLYFSENGSSGVYKVFVGQKSFDLYVDKEEGYLNIIKNLTNKDVEMVMKSKSENAIKIK